MIQRWKNYPFQSASYLTDEFKSFVKDLKKYILSKLPPGSELVNWSRGHFDASGFIKQGDKYVFFTVGDVRFRNWFDEVLIRVAAHDRDYVGGSNHYVSLDNFHEGVQKLFDRMKARISSR